MSEFILEMEHIVKKFPGVLALNDVDFSLRRGEVHVLLGENGAGKSTLVKILCGAYSKDSGRILLNGREVDFPDTRSAQKAGIAVIYQEFNLFPHLSVAENLFAGRPFLKGGTSLIDWSRIFDEAEQALQRVGLEIDPHLSVHELTVAQQQLLEIAKALTLDAKIIIMDEPTSALTESEIETLFDRIRELKSQGVSIIYISHRMDEIKRIGDRATVLRDGARVATVELSETSDDQLVQYMIGRRLEEKFPRGSVTVGETLLDVRGLSTDNGLKDISFSLRRGEILGIFGLLGSGRTELARAIFGADESASGSILIGGNERTIRRPLDAIRCKVALLPEDRRRHGLLLPMCVMHNITLSSLNKVSRGFGLIDHASERKVSRSLCEKLTVRTPGMDTAVANLSGGNQQKVVLAKWLCSQAEVFIFDEPTRGIDVGAKVAIYELMDELTNQGAGILMISSELPEILGMSDRVLVMNRGRILKEFDKEEVSEGALMHYASAS